MVLIRKISLGLLILSFYINYSYANNQESNGLQPVSIIELKIKPDRYINKHILVVGYLSDFPAALYINKEYERLSMGGDSLKIIDSTINGDFLKSGCAQKYVAVIGDFKKSNSKRDNFEYYYLTDISSAQSNEDGLLEFCYRKQMKGN